MTVPRPQRLLAAAVLAGTHDDWSRRGEQAMLWSGALSYPIYALHFPLAVTLVPLVGPVFPSALAGLAAVMLLVTLLSWLTLRHYDEPVRRCLTRSLARRPAAAPA